ncbi:hypothetical protein KC878_01390 [Candidatus Saccharibacteria bacterium]|nr:hypothetical protein [Candidatus Saccharibacteria bacterium]MCB9821136.1 hypothetical protein [Candidatus Nomurabacteria bacterium]
MHFLKKLGLWLSLLLFSLGLSIFTFSFIVNQTFGRVDVLKSWLADSNTYQNFLDVASKQIKLDDEQPKDNQEQHKSLVNNEQLKTAVLKAFTAKSAQTWVESVLDGIYAWLEGSAEQPSFTIDYSNEVSAFIDSMVDQVEVSYNALPECNTASARQQSQQNPIEAICKADALPTDEIKQNLNDDLLGEGGVFEKTTFTQDDLKIDKQASFFSFNSSDEKTNPTEAAAKKAREVVFYKHPTFSKIPSYYQQAKKVFWLGLIISFVGAVLAIFLADSRKKGTRKLGWRLVTSSIISILGGIILLFGAKIFTGAVSSKDAIEVQDIALPFVNEMLKDIIVLSAIIATVLLAVGVTIIILTKDKTAAKAPQRLSGSPQPAKK